MVRISRIFIQPEAKRYSLTRRILNKLAQVPVGTFPADGRVPETRGHTVVLAVNKGRFLRPFNEAGPDSYYLNFQTGCFYRCSYCYLQTYLDAPEIITVYVNQQDLARELKAAAESRPGQLTVYTGELTDSLIIDEITGYSKLFHDILVKAPVKRFEFRTKTTAIGSLLQCAPRDNIYITWSLNPPVISRQYEKGGASPGRRLRAAKTCAAKGFKIGFHLDPIIHTREWKAPYRALVDTLYAEFKPGEISYISLGCFRFKKSLKDRMGERQLEQFPELLDEFVPGQDGKYRYFRPIREAIYLYLLKLLKEKGVGDGVYLCMESGEISEQVMEKSGFL